MGILPRTDGFTLIELLVTVSLAAVLMMFAVPGLSGFVKSAQVRSAAYDLHGALATARSEALRLRARMVLCPSDDSTTSDPSCAGAVRDWSTGWLVFASGDDTFDASTDLLVKVGSGSDQGLEVRSNSTAVGAFAFAEDGTLDSAAGAVRIAICDERGGEHGVQIDIATLGASTSWKGAPGEPVSCSDPA